MRKLIDLIQEAVGPHSEKEIIDAIAYRMLRGEHFEPTPLPDGSYSWDSNSPYMLAGDLESDGALDSSDIDTDQFRDRLGSWLPERYRYVVEKLNGIAKQRGKYLVHRVIRVPADWREQEDPIRLGIYWTYDLEEWDASIGAYPVWGHNAEGIDIIIEALVTPDQINWVDTIKANMDYHSGDMENELRLIAGQPVLVRSIKLIVDGDIYDGKSYMDVTGRSFVA